MKALKARNLLSFRAFSAVFPQPIRVLGRWPRLLHSAPLALKSENYIRSMFSPGATVIDRNVDMRTSPGAAPFGFERNFR